MSKLNWKTRVGIVATIMAVIAGLLLIIKYQHEALDKQEALKTSIIKQRELINGITRAQSSYATKKDIERFSKELGVSLGPIKNDLKKFDAKIEGISTVKVITQGFKDENRKSDETIKRPEGVPAVDRGHSNKTQVLLLNEPFSNEKVPWGKVKFSSWEKKPWDLEIYEREYTVVNVLGTDEDGKHYVYNKFTMLVDGKSYVIDIDNGEFIEEYPESSFSFNPALYLGLDGGAYLSEVDYAITPNISLSLASYGQTKVGAEWIFFNLGVGYEVNKNSAVMVFSPVNYNIGKHIPLLNNTYVGPIITIDASLNLTAQLGIRVGL